MNDGKGTKHYNLRDGDKMNENYCLSIDVNYINHEANSQIRTMTMKSR